MRKLLAALAVVTASVSLNIVAADREYTQNVQDLKPGQCVFAGNIYNAGEMLKMDTGNTKVCTSISQRSIWIGVDEEDLRNISK